MNRLKIAINVLLGRTDAQRHYRTRVAQMEAEWLDLVVTISDTLEKLNAWHVRIVQREKRAAKEADQQAPPPAVGAPAVDLSAYKQQLRRQVWGSGAFTNRLAAKRAGAAQTGEAPNVNGGESQQG